MSNPLKAIFIDELSKHFGRVQKLPKSESLFDIDDGKGRIYFRYSKKHPGNRTFFGLRRVDLQALQGYPSVICLIWDGQREPLFVPFSEFEEVFASLSPAADGQYKVQIYEQDGGTELYIPNAGRFNVDSYFGWSFVNSLIEHSKDTVPELNHSQVQTLLGGIGATKGFEIWIPTVDRTKLDWTISSVFNLAHSLPPSLTSISEIAEEIDVIWLIRGGGYPVALFEIEHSTPIYSGLLRFNDVHLVLPNLKLRYGIVSNDERRSLFVRQLSRPTFEVSGLKEICAFFEYRNVYGWHERIKTNGQKNNDSDQ
jgi:hypothetical protein